MALVLAIALQDASWAARFPAFSPFQSSQRIDQISFADQAVVPGLTNWVTAFGSRAKVAVTRLHRRLFIVPRDEVEQAEFNLQGWEAGVAGLIGGSAGWLSAEFAATILGYPNMLKPGAAFSVGLFGALLFGAAMVHEFGHYSQALRLLQPEAGLFSRIVSFIKNASAFFLRRPQSGPVTFKMALGLNPKLSVQAENLTPDQGNLVLRAGPHLSRMAAIAGLLFFLSTGVLSYLNHLSWNATVIGVESTMAWMLIHGTIALLTDLREGAYGTEYTGLEEALLPLLVQEFLDGSIRSERDLQAFHAAEGKGIGLEDLAAEIQLVPLNFPVKVIGLPSAESRSEWFHALDQFYRHQLSEVIFVSLDRSGEKVHLAARGNEGGVGVIFQNHQGLRAMIHNHPPVGSWPASETDLHMARHISAPFYIYNIGTVYLLEPEDALDTGHTIFEWGAGETYGRKSFPLSFDLHREAQNLGTQLEAGHLKRSDISDEVMERMKRYDKLRDLMNDEIKRHEGQPVTIHHPYGAVQYKVYSKMQGEFDRPQPPAGSAPWWVTPHIERPTGPALDRRDTSIVPLDLLPTYLGKQQSHHHVRVSGVPEIAPLEQFYQAMDNFYSSNRELAYQIKFEGFQEGDSVVHRATKGDQWHVSHYYYPSQAGLQYAIYNRLANHPAEFAASPDDLRLVMQGAASYFIYYGGIIFRLSQEPVRDPHHVLVEWGLGHTYETILFPWPDEARQEGAVRQRALTSLSNVLSRHSTEPMTIHWPSGVAQTVVYIHGQGTISAPQEVEPNAQIEATLPVKTSETHQWKGIPAVTFDRFVGSRPLPDYETDAPESRDFGFGSRKWGWDPTDTDDPEKPLSWRWLPPLLVVPFIIVPFLGLSLALGSSRPEAHKGPRAARTAA